MKAGERTVNLDPTPTATELADLRAARRDFPRYQIDLDLALDRRRFIARRTEPGPGPHTLITGDLAELRAELAPSQVARPLPCRRSPGD